MKITPVGISNFNGWRTPQTPEIRKIDRPTSDCKINSKNVIQPSHTSVVYSFFFKKLHTSDISATIDHVILRKNSPRKTNI